jgi:O-antigen/teichoic acid export membrane protein
VKATLQKWLPANSFARGVAVLSGGTVGAQLLLLLAAPILTRLYSPEDFGILAVFIAILGILGIIASLRYELAIPIAEDNETALNVVALCLLITLGMATLTALLVWLAGNWFANLLNISEVFTYFWLLPVGVLLIGIYQTFNYWATREKAFGRISQTKLTQSVSSLLIQFSCFKLGPLGLIAGYIMGQFVGSLKLANSALESADRKSLSFKKMQSAAGRFRRFPQFTTWAGLLNTSGHQITPLILISFFGAGVAGWYALANRVVSMPANLLGSAIGNVFFAHAADAHRANRLAELVENVQIKLIAISLPIAVFIFLVGPDLFVLMFGLDWRIAGEFAQWLILSSFVGFLISSLSLIFPVLEQQKLGLSLQIVLFILKISGLMIGVMAENYLLAVILYAIGGAVGYSGYIVAICTIAGASMVKFLKKLFLTATISILIYLPVLLTGSGQFGEALRITGYSICIVLIATYYLLLLKTSLMKKYNDKTYI